MADVACIAALSLARTGALAFFFPPHPDRIAIDDIDLRAGDCLATTIARRLRQFSPDALILDVESNSPPIALRWRHGAIFGAGVVAADMLGVPCQYVSQSRLHRHFRLTSRDHDSPRLLARHLWPDRADDLFRRKIDRRRALAALAARYAANVGGWSA
jgi:hypothetical protein